MRTHAILLTLSAYPDDKGSHPRVDTVASDVVSALEGRGYEDVQVLSQDVHPR